MNQNVSQNLNPNVNVSLNLNCGSSRSEDPPRRFSMTQSPTKKRVALVLAGCGAKDGSEITETVSLLVALTQRGYDCQFFAPDRPQHHTVNHLTGQDGEMPRNILAESARIARGKVRPLTELRPDEFDALALPGGFGSAKNLFNFALAGMDASLHADMAPVLLAFARQKKPIAALCIAPMMLALVARELGVRGARITLGGGDARDAISAIESWGGTHVPCQVGEACVDETHRFVSAPAYMHADATPAGIFESAQALVDGLSRLLGTRTDG